MFRLWIQCSTDVEYICSVSVVFCWVPLSLAMSMFRLHSILSTFRSVYVSLRLRSVPSTFLSAYIMLCTFGYVLSMFHLPLCLHSLRSSYSSVCVVYFQYDRRVRLLDIPAILALWRAYGCQEGQIWSETPSIHGHGPFLYYMC